MNILTSIRDKDTVKFLVEHKDRKFVVGAFYGKTGLHIYHFKSEDGDSFESMFEDVGDFNSSKRNELARLVKEEMEIFKFVE